MPDIDNNRLAEKPRSITAGIRIFHPVSGIIILLTDYLFFGGELLVITLPLACTLSFVICFILVFIVQRRKNGDGKVAAFLKALAGAFVTALPTPISGTIVGMAILVLSGLREVNLPRR